eukprot:1136941-Pelagomonas_calceolata.AAC.2
MEAMRTLPTSTKGKKAHRLKELFWQYAALGHQNHNKCFSTAHLIKGMVSVDSPTHTQDDCVESDLGSLKLFAPFPVMLL